MSEISIVLPLNDKIILFLPKETTFSKCQIISDVPRMHLNEGNGEDQKRTFLVISSFEEAPSFAKKLASFKLSDGSDYTLYELIEN